MSTVDWSVWPPEDMTFHSAFLSTTNIIFAYSFAVCQYSFMAEMHTPPDYVKSIWALGLMEIFIYTLTGALVYAFVGSEVESPALLSAGPLISRIAFGIALPVIFISGSINSTVVGRYIMNRAFPKSEIRFIHDKRGWLVWIALIAAITIVAWVCPSVVWRQSINANQPRVTDHRRSHPFLQRIARDHLKSVHIRLHILLPSALLVPIGQGRKVVQRLEEHLLIHSECDSILHWHHGTGLRHLCGRARDHGRIRQWVGGWQFCL